MANDAGCSVVRGATEQAFAGIKGLNDNLVSRVLIGRRWSFNALGAARGRKTERGRWVVAREEKAEETNSIWQ
jgi:hypothetical protein